MGGVSISISKRTGIDMRRKIKIPNDGDTRIIKVFLIRPLRIGNEERWLEVTQIKQVYRGRKTPLSERGWINTEWVDK